jgi:hypothetical protein
MCARLERCRVGSQAGSAVTAAVTAAVRVHRRGCLFGECRAVLFEFVRTHDKTNTDGVLRAKPLGGPILLCSWSNIHRRFAFKAPGGSCHADQAEGSWPDRSALRNGR